MANPDSSSARFPLAMRFASTLAGRGEVRLPPDKELESILADHVDQAAQQWPGIELSSEAFAGHLAERVCPDLRDRTLLETLEALAVEDLWLAHACLTRAPRAWDVFERLLASVAAGALASLRLSEQERVEFLQQIREALLVGQQGREPKLAQFSGRGTLRSWLWVVLARKGRRFKSQERREETLEEAVSTTLVVGPRDPELDLIKSEILREFRTAFRSAVDALTERERDILRHWIVEGSTLEEVARRHGVHRVTAVRWLKTIRRSLLKNTRLYLSLRLGIGDDELSSAINVIQSRLDVTFADLLVA